jgi:outer membrane protein assembly factor BamA
MIRLSLILAIAACAMANEPLVVERVTVTGADIHVNLQTQVGRLYDASAIEQDVRYLWGLGRFDDVRVEMAEDSGGATVHFAVAPKPRMVLREIRMEPHSFGMQPKLPEGSRIDEFQAHQIAGQIEQQLKLQGYRQAQVSYRFVPAGKEQVDLRLDVDAGTAVRVKRVEFAGDLGLKPKDLRGSLSALRTKPMIPLLWKILPDYSPEAVDADAARLRSQYLSKGFFDAGVSVDETAIHGKDATVRFELQSGPRFQVHGVDMTKVCPCLIAQRREAERRGVLDFTAAIHVEREGAAEAEVITKVEEGEPFRVRRIDFLGLHRYSDTTARRNLLLDEGAPLDQYLLRKSVARLSETHLFEDMQSSDIVIQRHDAEHVADIKLRLKERKSGSWRLSGPVGPFSIAGPLQASVMARLPPWGQGILELSTYTASISLLAFAQPIIPALAVKKFVPLFALTRGFIPGDPWRTGFAVLPQLGWQGSLFATGAAQMQGRLLPLVNGPRGLVPELPVTVEGGVNGAILCEAPKPRLRLLRSAASLAIRMPGMLTGF